MRTTRQPGVERESGLRLAPHRPHRRSVAGQRISSRARSRPRCTGSAALRCWPPGRPASPRGRSGRASASAGRRPAPCPATPGHRRRPAGSSAPPRVRVADSIMLSMRISRIGAAAPEDARSSRGRLRTWSITRHGACPGATHTPRRPRRGSCTSGPTYPEALVEQVEALLSLSRRTASSRTNQLTASGRRRTPSASAATELGPVGRGGQAHGLRLLSGIDRGDRRLGHPLGVAHGRKPTDGLQVETAEHGRGRWRSTANTQRSGAGRPHRVRPAAQPGDDRLGHRVGVVSKRGRLDALGHLRVHEAGPHDHHADAVAGEGVAEALREGVEPGLGGRRRRSSTCRARSPATDESTTIVPWPWARRRARHGSSTEAAPMKLRLEQPEAAARGSRARRSWSPSTPKATSTRSTSPQALEQRRRRTPACASTSSASNAQPPRTSRGAGRLELARTASPERVRARRRAPRGRARRDQRARRWPARCPSRRRAPARAAPPQRVLHAATAVARAQPEAPGQVGAHHAARGRAARGRARHSSSRGYIARSSSGRRRESLAR